jgi:metal transporter CNNM
VCIDATPLCEIPIHSLPIVDESLPLLNILNAFQTGRSHMAIVVTRKLNPIAESSPCLPYSSGANITASSAGLPSPTATDEELTRQSSSRLRKLFRRRSSSSNTDDEEKKKIVEQRGEGLGDTAADLDGAEPQGIITLEDVLEELIGEGATHSRMRLKSVKLKDMGSYRDIRRIGCAVCF